MNNLKLLKKEFTFGNALSTVAWIGCLVIFQTIPTYPMYIGPFYMTLCIMLTFALNPQSSDILYTALLPVRKIDTVKARFLYCLTLEASAIVFSILWGCLHYYLRLKDNPAGINLTIAYLGFQLVLFSGFNLVFLGNIYKNPMKCGFKYFISAVVYFALYVIVELPIWLFKGYMSTLKQSGITGEAAIAKIKELGWYELPKLGYVCNSFEPECLLKQLIVFAIGFIIFTLCWPLTFRRAARQFEKYDI